MALRFLKNKYGMLVIGLIFLAIGIYQLNQTEVTCGGQVMKAGDVCEHSKAGITTDSNSTETEKATQHRTGLILTGLGSALTVGGLGWIIVSMARRKPEQPAQPNMPVASA
jgi:hypothetical protein